MIRDLLLPLLFLATGISSSPYGYQYQLPKEYNRYSHGNSGSYSQLEPFRRFLKNYMSSQDNSPYQYMNHHMDNVQVRSEMPNPSVLHYQEDKFINDREKYMVGELFFKDHEEKEHDHVHFHDEEHENEELPYTVVEKYQNYEKRLYPSVTFVCNKTSIDTAADPLAGLEKMNPYELMMTRRYQKAPRSQMFWELFKYIQGVNQNQEEIEMTSPVVVFHKVIKETTIGDYEEVEMCFYLPKRYQENHEHNKNQRHHDEHHKQNVDHQHNANSEHPEDHEHQENRRHHDKHHEQHEDHQHNANSEHPEDHEHQENQRHHDKHHEQNEDHQHNENSEHLEDHVHQANEINTKNHEHNEDQEHHEDHEQLENNEFLENLENQRHKETHDLNVDHEHPEDHEQPENLENIEDVSSFRHAAVPPPKPMDNGRVYLYTRPAMQVFVRRFGGFALTHQTWEEQREILEDDILSKNYNKKEYFTASYDNPWKLGNKRNEIWIQCLEPFQTLPEAVSDVARKQKSNKAEHKNKNKTVKA